MKPVADTTATQNEISQLIEDYVIPNIGLVNNFYTVLFDAVRKHTELSPTEVKAWNMSRNIFTKVVDNMGTILKDETVLTELVKLDKLTT
jgi:hypothetical protein